MILMQTAYCLDYSLPLKNAIEYIERYNRVFVKNVLFLTSNSFTAEEAKFYNMLQTVSNSHGLTLTLTPHMIKSRNINDTIHLVKRSNVQSVAVINDFYPSQMVSKSSYKLYLRLTRDMIWLVILSGVNKTEADVRKFILDSTIPLGYNFSKLLINAKIYVVADANGIVRLFELYQICKDGHIIVEELAQLSGHEKNHLSVNFIWERRSNLFQCPFRVGYFEMGHLLRNQSSNNGPSSMAMKTQRPNKRQTLTANGITMHGPITQHWALLKSILNFSIEWVYVTDKRYGSFDDTTNDWNGIVGMIKRGEIDTSIMDLSITAERNPVLRYASPFIPYKTKLFMKKPEYVTSWNTYVDVFHTTYWCMMAAAFIICFIYLFLLNLYGINLVRHSTKPSMIFSIIGKSLSTTSRAFGVLDVDHLNHDGNRNTFIASRILTLTICLCGMLNFYVYNAGLISTLMVRQYDIPIRQIEDILKKPQYKLLVSGGDATESFLKNSNNVNHRKIWEKTDKENGIVKNIGEGEKKILEDHYNVLFAESPTFEMSFDSYPCEIVAAKISYFNHYAAYAFNKDSPYVEMFSHQVNRIIEKGIETEKFDPQKKATMKCENEDENYFISCSYSAVVSVFYLFGTGCVIALGHLGIEYVATKMR